MPIHKKTILLFQGYLRKHILNFGIELKSFIFIHDPQKKISRQRNLKEMPVEKIFQIRKKSFITQMRQLLGIPNLQIKFTKEDIIFTYGCLLFTNKPYCVYIENAIAIFNYNTEIAKHPLAQHLVKFLLRRSSCRKIIFMSEAAKTGFLSTMQFSEKELLLLSKKFSVCYPLILNPSSNIDPQRKLKADSTVKFLFTGTFYIKGGLEILNSFKRISREFPNTELSIVTGIESIWPKDLLAIQSTPNVNIFDAAFSEKDLYEKFYNTHHVFLYPTYRDSFGLVLIEALSAGLPIIGTNQYATSEMLIDGFNGYILEKHPLQDYKTDTFEIIGKLSEPADFFNQLFKLQKAGHLEYVEEFLYQSMKRLLGNPALLEEFSRNSLALYEEKFSSQKISQQIESVFLEALEK
ncbi:MAG: glycosyltransferase family 4 protein [Candidatus Moranbacteria bacterium]|nr:glycosyltransferase family 4 protein [Candidatus Moranbacteria bacterium]